MKLKGLRPWDPTLGHSYQQDPRLWSRNEVGKWLLWCQEEFDLPTIDINQFQMNGKALCLLMKTDFNERAPKAGDVLYNAVHLLLLQASVNEESQRNRFTSSSHNHHNNNNNSTNNSNNHHLHNSHLRLGNSYPVDATTGGCLLPNDVNNSGSWATAWPFVSSDYHNVGHIIQSRYDVQGSAGHSRVVEGTVILSPAPSIDSANSNSPRLQQEELDNCPIDDDSPISREHAGHQSDSINATESSESELGSPRPPTAGPHPTPQQQPATALALTKPKKLHPNNNNSTNHDNHPHTIPTSDTVNSSPISNVTTFEQPVTNGRLLWDFLHQLLNDPSQRYNRCIGWKEKDTGIFKIFDPHGLAQLWGMQKNHLNMNFDKMSRALRYYYRVNILKKVQGERHCYQFLRQPVELKACKQRALLNRYSLTTKYNYEKPSVVSLKTEDTPTPAFKQETS